MSKTNMNAIIKRLKQARSNKEYSYQDLADLTGMSKSTLQRYETGDIENIPLSKLSILADALDIEPEYLMGWERETEPFDIFSIPGILPIETYKIPLLGSVSCGKPNYEEEDFEGYVNVGTQVKADYAIRAKGDSMIGARILDGDIVLVRQQPTVENGEIAVVSIDDEITLKRFRKAGSIVLLIPDNPAYKTIEVDLKNNDTVRILGKAVAFQSDVR